MENIKKSTNMPVNIVAIISCVIGLLGSFGLIIFGIIGATPLIALISIFMFSLLVFCFKDHIESFNLRELSAKMKSTDAMIAKETEPLKSSFIRVEAIGTDDDTKAVISALGSTKYTWRYPPSVARDTNLPIDLINDKINWMIINNLATEARGAAGKIYGLSPKGRDLFNVINKTA